MHGSVNLKKLIQKTVKVVKHKQDSCCACLLNCLLFENIINFKCVEIKVALKHCLDL